MVNHHCSPPKMGVNILVSLFPARRWPCKSKEHFLFTACSQKTRWIMLESNSPKELLSVFLGSLELEPFLVFFLGGLDGFSKRFASSIFWFSRINFELRIF